MAELLPGSLAEGSAIPSVLPETTNGSTASATIASAVTAAAAVKPSVLIIGGLGYCGRFLALYIHNNDLASEVRIVDKQLPELAWLAPEFSEACSRNKFMQADGSRKENLSRIFTRPAPNQHKEYDYVINCGGETRYSQSDDIYRLRSHALSITLGIECARRNIPVYIELSTGQVYSPSRIPRKENHKCKPVLRLAKWKLKAEQDLAAVVGLNLVVLRLANVYGNYCGTPLANACCAARVYQEEGKDMRWLWDKELRVDTVHVEDVARAIWAVAEWYTRETSTHVTLETKEPREIMNVAVDNQDEGTQNTKDATIGPPVTSIIPVEDRSSTASAPAQAQPTPSHRPSTPIATMIQPTSTPLPPPPIRPTPIFNITSPQPTTQLHLSSLLSTYFSIPSTFTSSLLSPFARLSLSTIVNSANEELMDPWADLLESAKITRPGPISPFMEKELLSDKDLSLDGADFVRRTGFVYQRKGLNGEELKEVVESWKRMGWWP